MEQKRLSPCTPLSPPCVSSGPTPKTLASKVASTLMLLPPPLLPPPLLPPPPLLLPE
jgi:hypothetical protein